jgi:hypothetical protein
LSFSAIDRVLLPVIELAVARSSGVSAKRVAQKRLERQRRDGIMLDAGVIAELERLAAG